MQRLAVLLVLLALAIPAFAQRTKVAVLKPTTEYDDSKAMSDDVPDVYAISGNFERFVVLRFKHQTDLLAGLEKMVAAESIKNGVILAAAGSLRGYHIHSVSNRVFPSNNTYIKDPTHPADIISMNGYVVNGKIHPHITLADDERSFGGHLEPGSDVFTFAVVTIGVFGDDVDLSRIDDKTHR